MQKYFKLIRNIAITGNAVYVLWILFNAIDDGFKASLVEIVSCVGLVALLITNTVLLIGYKKDTL